MSVLATVKRQPLQLKMWKFLKTWKFLKMRKFLRRLMLATEIIFAKLVAPTATSNVQGVTKTLVPQQMQGLQQEVARWEAMARV